MGVLYDDDDTTRHVFTIGVLDLEKHSYSDSDPARCRLTINVFIGHGDSKISQILMNFFL